MFCEKCGNKLIESKCLCGHIKFNNPVPVAIALIPVMEDNNFVGFLGVKRAIDPKKGQLALPGGFQVIEPLYSALKREVKEECGIDIEVDEAYQPLIYSSEPIPNRLLVFIVAKRIEYKSIDWSFISDETLSLNLIKENDTLAFPLHTKAKDIFFNKFKG